MNPIMHNCLNISTELAGHLLLLLRNHNLRLDGDRQRLHHLGFNFVHFSHSLPRQLVQLCLVAHVQPGRCEDTNPGEYCQGQQVEKCSNIGHHIKTQAKLQCVHLGEERLNVNSTGYERLRDIYSQDFQGERGSWPCWSPG